MMTNGTARLLIRVHGVDGLVIFWRRRLLRLAESVARGAN